MSMSGVCVKAVLLLYNTHCGEPRSVGTGRCLCQGISHGCMVVVDGDCAAPRRHAPPLYKHGCSRCRCCCCCCCCCCCICGVIFVFNLVCSSP
jgi:hypothetical protein